jgi:hypothetical protein
VFLVYFVLYIPYWFLFFFEVHLLLWFSHMEVLVIMVSTERVDAVNSFLYCFFCRGIVSFPCLWMVLVFLWICHSKVLMAMDGVVLIFIVYHWL